MIFYDLFWNEYLCMPKIQVLCVCPSCSRSNHSSWCREALKLKHQLGGIHIWRWDSAYLQSGQSKQLCGFFSPQTSEHYKHQLKKWLLRQKRSKFIIESFFFNLLDLKNMCLPKSIYRVRKNSRKKNAEVGQAAQWVGACLELLAIPIST